MKKAFETLIACKFYEIDESKLAPLLNYEYFKGTQGDSVKKLSTLKFIVKVGIFIRNSTRFLLLNNYVELHQIYN